MNKSDIHQEIYFSVTILAFVTAAITQIIDPNTFPVQFASRTIKAYSLLIALLVLFYVIFTKYWETLSLSLLASYQRRLRLMLFFTALFILVVLEPDLFGKNAASLVYDYLIVFVAVPYNVAMTILLALSPWLQQTRLRRFDILERWGRAYDRHHAKEQP